jgi:hypothetical protein
MVMMGGIHGKDAVWILYENHGYQADNNKK